MSDIFSYLLTCFPVKRIIFFLKRYKIRLLLLIKERRLFSLIKFFFFSLTLIKNEKKRDLKKHGF